MTRPSLLPQKIGADPLVLVVDDYPTLPRALSRIRCPRHGRVCVRWALACSAQEALALLEGGELPALVVSDERMPGMLGTELLELVGQRWPTVRRMMLSGWTIGGQVMAAPWPVVDKDNAGAAVVERVCRLARGED